ncbi:MAG: PepSY-associated TM helix domain-containing protein [Sulfurimonadaceae bacterium]
MYKKFWFKAHFILGLAFGFILLITATTGGLLSFEKEILKLINSKSYVVSVPNDVKKAQAHEMIAALKQHIPDAKINAVTLSSNPTSSAVITIASSNPQQRKGINYYINPYTYELLPHIQGESFFKTVEDIHRRLMLGNIGKQLVGVSSIVLVILLFSGLYLYFPRLKRTFLASFTFSFKSKGRYFLHSIHSSIGLWVLPLYLVAVLTGLYWSYDWYRQGLHTLSGVALPVKPTMNVNKNAQNHTLALEQNKKEPQLNRKKSTITVDTQLSKAFKMFEIFLQKEYSSATIRVPNKGSVYTISYFDEDIIHSRARNQMQIDIHSWELIKHERYENKPLNEKLISSMLPLHSGEYFGIIGQTLMFIASMLMPLFAITGLMLYINRKQNKKKKA